MKYRIIIILTALVATLFISETASAQDPPPSRWWRIPKLAEQVNLTDLQKQQLDNLFESNRKNLRTLRDQVEDERLVLEDRMSSDNLNEPSVLAQLAKVSKSRTALEEATTKYFLEMRKILGAEKFRQVLEIGKLLKNSRKLKGSPDKD